MVFELVNEQGTAIGRQTYSKRAEYSPWRDGNQISIAYNKEDFVSLTFDRVKAADISDTGMSIRVASVNGAPPERTPFQITMISDWEKNTFLLVEDGVVIGFRSGVDASRYRNLVIPATLWAEPVVAIGNNAFEEKNLDGVVIPDSVTTIGNNAFTRNDLGSIVIGKGVTSIMDNAFSFNPVYRSITIPGNVAFVTVSTLEERKPLFGRDSYGNIAMLRQFDADGFMAFYNRKGKKAGTYTVKGQLFTSWKYSPE
ncbi:MAG: leucine-rich repeat domain-containing protein [Treponema sp.]|nr:leucine-rich repeat domain-containing protein [Treponema sp.]